MNLLNQVTAQLVHETVVEIIRRRFEEHGIELTDEQLDNIAAQLQDEEEVVSIQINDDQLDESVSAADYTIDLSDFMDEAEEIYGDLAEKFMDELPGIIERSSDGLYGELEKGMPRMVEERKEDRLAFEASLYEIWERPLDLLEAMIQISLEAGQELNEGFRSTNPEEADDAYTLEALTRSHARACQIASEILTLLKSGYADGAHARWRALHEVAIVTSFIAAHDDDVAERYLLHGSVESYKAAKQYQKHCEALNQEPYSETELNEFESRHQELIHRFGKPYGSRYGWAGKAMRPNNPKFKPNLSQLEEAVGIDHLRPYYKMASHNVHAGPKGIMFRLGLSTGDDHILLAGPSQKGLADPAHATAISLSQITTTLLALRPNFDRLLMMKACSKLVEEIGDELRAVHESMENYWSQ